jgi:hypothetical protein
MLVFMAVNAQEFPVAAVERIVVVVVVLVMYGQLAQAHTGELTATSTANVRVQLERPFAISRLAFRAMTARLGYNAVESRLTGNWGLGHNLFLTIEHHWATRGASRKHRVLWCNASLVLNAKHAWFLDERYSTQTQTFAEKQVISKKSVPELKHDIFKSHFLKNHAR